MNLEMHLSRPNPYCLAALFSLTVVLTLIIAFQAKLTLEHFYKVRYAREIIITAEHLQKFSSSCLLEEASNFSSNHLRAYEGKIFNA